MRCMHVDEHVQFRRRLVTSVPSYKQHCRLLYRSRRLDVCELTFGATMSAIRKHEKLDGKVPLSCACEEALFGKIVSLATLRFWLAIITFLMSSVSFLPILGHALGMAEGALSVMVCFEGMIVQTGMQLH